MGLNFWKLQILTKSPETLQKWLNQSLFMKKLSLAYPAPILVLLQNVQNFTYGAFKGFICGMFIYLATLHIASKLLETLPTSLNHWLFIRELSFRYFWCTGERFLELTFANERKQLSFMCLNFSKFPNSNEITRKFAKMTEPVFVYEKTQFGLLSTHLSAFAECVRFHLWSFQGFSQWYVCLFGNSSYGIQITWTFANITESLAFHQRTTFRLFVMHWRKVPRVDLCKWT